MKYHSQRRVYLIFLSYAFTVFLNVAIISKNTAYLGFLSFYNENSI